MPHRRSSAILATILGLLAVVLPPSPPSARAEVVATASPLVVTIDSLMPGSLPRRGLIQVTGTVTNSSADTWTAVRVYPFISATPMTTTTELAEASTVPESVDVGHRITDDAFSATVGDLTPGQTAAYSLSLPAKAVRKEIRARTGGPLTEGVYWFGVHAMDGSDNLTDGRARSFLPFVKQSTSPVRTAVVVPLRAQVARTADGSVEDVARWVKLLSPDGRLDKLLRVGLAAPVAQQLTWLVDPAVLDAVQQLADGNQPRWIGSTNTPDQEKTEGESPSASTSASPSEQATPSAETTEAARLASTWLSQMLEVLKESEVLGLPYGDLDLTATAHHGSSLYQPARERSVAYFEKLGIRATQVDAPAGGVLDAAALSQSGSTPVLVSDEALPQTSDGPGPVVADAAGARLIVSSSAALDGGPGPGDRQAVVPLRQRLLAEAAVRALDPTRTPLVVKLAATWTPSDPEEFASGLQAPWLDVTGVNTATESQLGPSVMPSELRYSAADEAAEVPESRFKTASALITRGTTLQRVLTDNDQIAGELTDEALTGLSVLSRGSGTDPAVAAERWVFEQLSQVDVQGPAAVTLSGTSGPFPATLVNGLDQPVTVRLEAVTDAGVSITTPKRVKLSAGGQSTVVIQANDTTAGVHRVTLRVTDTDGAPLGSSIVVPVRAAQVSGIIWLFIAVGIALLFGTIALRLIRRVRKARAS